MNYSINNLLSFKEDGGRVEGIRVEGLKTEEDERRGRQESVVLSSLLETFQVLL